MKTAIKVALMTLLVCGGLLLVLGAIIWIGHSEQLVAVHITIGLLLILALWTIAAIAARSGVPAGPVMLAAAWGLLVVAFGMAQEELLPGSWHWSIQVLHPVISMGAIWWGRRLVRLIGRAQQYADSRSAAALPPVTVSSRRPT